MINEKQEYEENLKEFLDSINISDTESDKNIAPISKAERNKRRQNRYTTLIQIYKRVGRYNTFVGAVFFIMFGLERFNIMVGYMQSAALVVAIGVLSMCGIGGLCYYFVHHSFSIMSSFQMCIKR